MENLNDALYNNNVNDTNDANIKLEDSDSEVKDNKTVGSLEVVDEYTKGFLGTGIGIDTAGNGWWPDNIGEWIAAVVVIVVVIILVIGAFVGFTELIAVIAVIGSVLVEVGLSIFAAGEALFMGAEAFLVTMEIGELIELAGEALGTGFTTLIEGFDVVGSVLLEDTMATKIGQMGRWVTSFGKKFWTFNSLEGNIFKKGWTAITNGFLVLDYFELGKDIWKGQFAEGLSDFILRPINKLNIFDDDAGIFSFDGKHEGTIESKVDLAIKILDKVGLDSQVDWLNDIHEKDVIIGALV